MKKVAPPKPKKIKKIDFNLLSLTHSTIPYIANNKKTCQASLIVNTEYDIRVGNKAIVHPT